MNIPTLPLKEPREVLAIDGKFLVKVSHMLILLTLILFGNHLEYFQPLIISSPLSPVVVGLPWLKEQKPLTTAQAIESTVPAESAEEIDLSTIPREYHGLQLISFLARRVPSFTPSL